MRGSLADRATVANKLYGGEAETTRPKWSGNEARIQSLVAKLATLILDDAIQTAPLHQAQKGVVLRRQQGTGSSSPLRVAYEAQSSKMQSIALNLLASRLRPDLSPDPTEATVQIQNKVMRLVPHGPQLVQALEIVRNITSSNVAVDNKLSILYLLTALANNAKAQRAATGTVSATVLASGPSASGSSFAAGAGPSAPGLGKLRTGALEAPDSLHGLNARLSMSIAVPKAGVLGYSPRLPQEGTKLLSSLHRPSKGALTLTSAGGPGKSTAQTFTQTFTHENPNTNSEVPESELLLDLIPVLRGRNGQHIEYYPEHAAFLVKPHVGVSLSQRGLIRRIGELGVYYRQIEEVVTPVIVTTPRSTDEDQPIPNGLTRQSFAQALSEELAFFTQVLSIFQAQVGGVGGEQGGAGVSQPSNVSLRKLLAWLQEALSRLKVLAALAESTRNLEGGMLLSALLAYTTHGDELGVADVARRVIRAAGRPLLAFLHCFMTRGEVTDPFKEFFIRERLRAQPEEFWYSRFSIDSRLLPSGVSYELAERILTIGKTVAFIRTQCVDPTFSIPLDPHRLVNILYATQSASGSAFGSVGGGRLEDLQVRSLIEALEDAERSASARLMKLLRMKFDFDRHCLALRRYVLHGRGDFIRQLIEVGYSDFNKPASSLLRHVALSLVESACAASTARYENQDILGRIRVRINRTGEGEPAWNAFTLDYLVDGPLTVVFDSATMEKYLAISHLLWRLKRHEVALQEAWQRQCAARHLLRLLTGGSSMSRRRRLQIGGLLLSPNTAVRVEQLMRRLHLLRHHMAHALGFVSSHFANHVIETAWTEFSRRMRLAFDASKNSETSVSRFGLDEITALHRVYIQTIATGLFLAADSELATTLRENLYRIFECVQQFDQFHEKVINYLTDEAKKLSAWQLERDAESSAQLEAARQQFGRVIERLGDHLSSQERKYNEVLVAFLKALNRYGRYADAEQQQKSKQGTDDTVSYSLRTRHLVLGRQSSLSNIQVTMPLLVPDSMRTAGLGVLIDFNEYYAERQNVSLPATRL